MNKRMVLFVLGRLLQINAALLTFPLIVSLIYDEPIKYTLSFLVVGIFSAITGYLLSMKPPKVKKMYAKEGFIIVSASWFLLSLVGALPFVLSGDIPSIIDAIFETASGFTTSGTSILDDVEALGYSTLFWRSFTHLVGGMGVLVFALAILPQTDSESVHIMKAEVPGPTFGKIVSKLSSSARILYIIYLGMTAVLVLVLFAAGMNFFDSMLHAFGVAGTGGFGIKNGSVAPYDSVTIEIILGVGMLIFGVNFNIYYYMLFKNVKEIFRSEEIKWYLGIVLSAILLITIQLTLENVHSVTQALRHSFFTVSSIITTSGFSTDNFGQWPLFSQVILLLLMFIGGMAGSTAGGLKVSRIAIMVKTAFSELKRMAYPNRVVSLHFESKPLGGQIIKAVANYLLVYLIIFVALVLLLSIELPDFMSAFSAVATTFNNIGPGLGVVGPDASFSLLSPFSKVLLSIAMIMGRLEIFPVLILFSPNTWRKKA